MFANVGLYVRACTAWEARMHVKFQTKDEERKDKQREIKKGRRKKKEKLKKGREKGEGRGESTVAERLLGAKNTHQHAL